MEKLAKQRVGDIVTLNYKTAKVFTEHNIDFCCGGGITLQEACNRQKEDLDKVITDLQDVLKSKENQSWQALALDELIDLIVQDHHSYIRATIPALRIYLNKLCKVHGGRHKQLLEIRSLFEEVSTDLIDHLEKEENILFPYIKAMVSSMKMGFSLSKPHFDDIENPISKLEHEHDSAGEKFKKISQLTDKYNPPADGCQTFKVAYALLKEFEEDLHKHVHLENNILFPSSRNVFSHRFN